MLLVQKMAMIRQREATFFSKNVRKLSEVTPVDGRSQSDNCRETKKSDLTAKAIK